jgi:thioredoxin-related protein
MRNLLIGGALLLIGGMVYAFTAPQAKVQAVSETAAIKWYSWDEAIAASKKNPKKIFIDVYTDWCGWCKRMDQTTFQDAKVVEYLNKNFFAVKFNAEQKQTIEYKNHTLKFVASGGRGYHELAFALLDGRLGYPAFVYLDEKQDRITISPGYKDAGTILKELKFVAEGHYKTKNFQDYAKGAGK